MLENYHEKTLKTIEEVTSLVKDYYTTIDQVNLNKRNKFLLHKVFFSTLPLQSVSNIKDVGNYLYDLMHKKIKDKFPNNYQRLINEYLFLKDENLSNDLQTCLDIIIRINYLNKHYSSMCMNEEDIN